MPLGDGLLVLQLRCGHLQGFLGDIGDQVRPGWRYYVKLPLTILLPFLRGVVGLYRISFWVFVYFKIPLVERRHNCVVPLMKLTIFAIGVLSIPQSSLLVIRRSEPAAFVASPHASLLLVVECALGCLFELDIVGLV